MKGWSLVILLILFLTPMLYANEFKILEPPAEIMEDTTLVMFLPAGTWTLEIAEGGAIAISPAGWRALSKWVWEEHVRSCESAIAEAIKGQMKEIEKLKRQRKTLLIGSAITGTLALLGGIIIIVR